MRLGGVMLVSSAVMSTEPSMVPADACASEAAELMRRETVDVLLVVEGQRAVGVLTAFDLITGAGTQGADGRAMRVQNLGRPLIEAGLDDDLFEVQQRMLGLGVEFAVVVDQGRIMGLLSLLQASIALSGPAPCAFGG